MNIDYDSLLIVREFPDRGVKWLLESPENVHALMDIIEPDLARNIDFNSLENVPKSFIPDNFREQESDIVFTVPYRDVESGKERKITIYVLIEHQSKPDRVMSFRVLFYTKPRNILLKIKRIWRSFWSGPAPCCSFWIARSRTLRLITKDLLGNSIYAADMGYTT